MSRGTKDSPDRSSPAGDALALDPFLEGVDGSPSSGGLTAEGGGDREDRTADGRFQFLAVYPSKFAHVPRGHGNDPAVVGRTLVDSIHDLVDSHRISLL